MPMKEFIIACADCMSKEMEIRVVSAVSATLAFRVFALSKYDVPEHPCPEATKQEIMGATIEQLKDMLFDGEMIADIHPLTDAAND